MGGLNNYVLVSYYVFGLIGFFKMFFLFLEYVKKGMKVYFIDKSKVYIYIIIEILKVILEYVEVIDDIFGKS